MENIKNVLNDKQNGSNAKKSDYAIKKEFQKETSNPWHSEVDKSEMDRVLVYIADEFKRYLSLPEHIAPTMAVWVLLTYGFYRFDFSIRLAIVSATHRCGKSTLLEMLNQLVHNPVMSGAITASSLFRTIALVRPTFLIDEADTFMSGNEEIRGIINMGYKSNGRIIKSEKTDDGWQPANYDCFSPMAIASINAKSIPTTVLDRSIVIRMSRKSRFANLEKFRESEAERKYVDVRRKCLRFMNDNAGTIAKQHPKMPDALSSRAADGWEPLLALAQAISPEWGKKIWDASIALSDNASDEDDLNLLLISDIRDIFVKTGEPFLLTKDLIAELVKLEERKWSIFGVREKPLTPYHLAAMLKDFDIRPRNKHLPDDRVWKGYFLDDCQKVFDKYLLPLKSDAESDNASEVADTSTGNKTLD